MKYTREELNGFIKEISSFCTSIISCEECPFHSGSGCAFRKNPNMWEELKPKKKIVPLVFSLEEDRNALRDRWIINKETGSETKVQSFTKASNGFWTVDLFIDVSWISMIPSALLENFVFADGPNKGKPVGKEVEE